MPDVVAALLQGLEQSAYRAQSVLSNEGCKRTHVYKLARFCEFSAYYLWRQYGLGLSTWFISGMLLLNFTQHS